MNAAISIAALHGAKAKRMSRQARASALRTAVKTLRARRKYEERYVAALRGAVRNVSDAMVRAVLNGRHDARHTGEKEQLENVFRETEKPLAKQVTSNYRSMFDDVADANANAVATLGLPVRPAAGVVDLYTAKVADNVGLIKADIVNLQEEMLSILDDLDNVGIRAEDLAELLADRCDVADSRAMLIARDQTLKANAALNELRQTDAGVESYTWSTSQDERVREEHAILEGEEFSWDDPPEPGHPGEDVQCRCTAIPVIPEFEGLDL